MYTEKTYTHGKKKVLKSFKSVLENIFFTVAICLSSKARHIDSFTTTTA